MSVSGGYKVTWQGSSRHLLNLSLERSSDGGKREGKMPKLTHKTSIRPPCATRLVGLSLPISIWRTWTLLCVSCSYLWTFSQPGSDWARRWKSRQPWPIFAKCAILAIPVLCYNVAKTCPPATEFITILLPHSWEINAFWKVWKATSEKSSDCLLV